MKKVKLTKYICSYCGREFFEEEEAVKCEDFHAKIKRIAEVSEYDASNKKKANRYPKEITIEMTDGSIAKYEFAEATEPEKEETESQNRTEDINKEEPANEDFSENNENFSESESSNEDFSANGNEDFLEDNEEYGNEGFSENNNGYGRYFNREW